MFITMIIGVVVFLCSVQPPDLIVWVNLFAFGGLECAFLCPIIGGLYWKRANASGCLFSIVCGLAAFFFFTLNGVKIAGALPIVPSLLIAVAAFIVGSLLGAKSNDEITRVMFAD
jgi:sodium/pantothenate symporter